MTTLEDFYDLLTDTQDGFIWAMHPQTGAIRAMRRRDYRNVKTPNTYCPVSAVLDYYPSFARPEIFANEWLDMEKADALKIVRAADNNQFADNVVRERLLLATQPLTLR